MNDSSNHVACCGAITFLSNLKHCLQKHIWQPENHRDMGLGSFDLGQ